jgi:hypothetical protein
MKNPIKTLGSRSKLILLQVAAFSLGCGLPPVVSMGSVWIWDTVFGLTGAAMGIVAIARCGRDGQSPRRLLVSCALVFAGCVVAWWVVAFLAGALLDALFGSGEMSYYVGFRYTQLPIFTTGCLAYLGLGPFRSQSSEAPAATSR